MVEDIQHPLSFLYSHLEAILFAAAAPLDETTISQILEITEAEVKPLIVSFSQQLKEQGRGIELRISGAGIELVTASECSYYVRKIREKEEKLSKAAMETLSIIAFKQPVTKAEIEEMRGVNSEKVIKQLLQRQMICELGRKDTIGRPLLYGTTEEFMRVLGITSIQDLGAHENIEEASK